jgi:nucleotide-binding universal stress UspA family protein
MKILLAVDGSDYTKRAALFLATLVGELRKPPEIHLLTVHAPLPYAGAATAVAGASAVKSYHEEECKAALLVAESLLAKAGLEYESSWTTGDIGEAIAGYEEKKGIDLIVMGSHGHGALRNLALGSVADAVLRAAKCPVTIVR